MEMMMPAPEEVYEQLRVRLRGAPDRKTQDELLDLWLKNEQEATEWDARMWDFDPDEWMREERYMIAQTGKVPRVVRKSSS